MLCNATRDSACVIVVRYLCTTLAMLLITKLVRASRGFKIIWKGIYHMDRSIADFLINIDGLSIERKWAVKLSRRGLFITRIKICSLFQFNKKW